MMPPDLGSLMGSTGMTITGTHIFVLGIVAAFSVIAYLVKRFSGPPFLLRRWASDHGFRILHCEFHHFSKGPFTWKSSHRGQEVYHVRVRDFEGRERSGWVRCTSNWGSDKTDVEWDPEHHSSAV